MHSRKHGKSGSHKPVNKIKIDYDKDELESLILKLARENKTPSEIGIILRDQYGIPDVRSADLRIRKVIEKETSHEVPEDLYNLIKKAVRLYKHMEANRKDSKSKHGLELVESKIRRLVKYYVKTKRLPSDWKYTIEKARLLVK
jgi:small subunit ribosomal protein S15